MLTLEQISKETDALWSDNGSLTTMPNLPIQVQDHIAAYRELGLGKHESDTHFYAKCEIAQKMGFKKVTGFDITRMLVGEEKITIKERILDRQITTLEKFYDPLFNKTLQANFHPRSYSPPFFSWEKWNSIHMVDMGALKCAIPYGVLLRVIELQKMNFFNCFLAFAPEAVIREGTYASLPTIDPVITATLTKGHKTHRWNNDLIDLTEGEFEHFFVAKW